MKKAVSSSTREAYLSFDWWWNYRDECTSMFGEAESNSSEPGYTKYKYKIQIQNTKYKIQNTKYKYKIQLQNTNTKYKYTNTQKHTQAASEEQHTKQNTHTDAMMMTKQKYKIQIQNTNTKYKYQIQIPNINTK